MTVPTQVTCENNGHLYGSQGVCLFCKTPKPDQSLDSEATQQLELIARAIRDLEGMAVPYRLARKLHEVMLEIAKVTRE